MTPPLIVSRTVTVVEDGEDGYSKDISAFRQDRAYVLLGDPGSGKTTKFKQEAEADGGICISARHFLRDAGHRPEWRHKTLFIDGLDEVRARDNHPHNQLDNILKNLQDLDLPRVRISCRSSFWLMGIDENEVRSLSGYENMPLLSLDPLTKADVNNLLAKCLEQGPHEFVATAHDRGLGELLYNPQTLELLVTAFSAENCWPTSKIKTFEMACSELAKEMNPQHKPARMTQVINTYKKVSAAGCLTSFLLTSGKEKIAGVGSTDADADEMSLRLDDISDDVLPAGGRNALAAALGTKLFRSSESHESFVPVHLNVAEYLAARYLHERMIDTRIEKRTPPNRVLSLLEGSDGVVVPSLRGLAAWLATLNSDARARLMEQVPLEMLAFGDPTVLPQDQKQLLLRELAQLPRHYALRLGRVSPAVRSALASTETTAFLRSYIADPDPTDSVQLLVDFLFDGLAYDPSPHGAFSVCEAINVARDDRWWFRVRKQALSFALRIAERNEDFDHLQAMLKDVSTERVEDWNQEFRARLIEGLYPLRIGPSELLQFLPRRIGTILGFHLSRTLAEKTKDFHLPDVLDMFCKRDRDQVDRGDYTTPFAGIDEEVFVQLLDRGLQQHGDAVDIPRLYDWLSVHPEYSNRIRSTTKPVEPWLRERPDIRRFLLREHVRREIKFSGDGQHSSGELNSHMRMSGILFLGLSSTEAATMCFDEAVAAATSLDIACQYIQYSEPYCRAMFGPASDTTYRQTLPAESVKWMLARVEGHPELVQCVESLAELRESQQRKFFDDELAAYHKRVRQEVRERRSTLRGERSPNPQFVWEIGVVYLGLDRHSERSLEPVKRLQQWLSSNEDQDDKEALTATNVALDVLSSVPINSDVPHPNQLLAWRRDRKTWAMTYPFLAGLDHRGAIPRPFDDDRIRSALCLHYSTVLNDKGLPEWVVGLFDSKPWLVAEVIIEVLTTLIRDKCDYEVHHPRSLPADLFREVVPRLLDAFPVHGTKRHVEHLRWMFDDALLRVPKDYLLPLVERKLRIDGMDVAQRALLLGIALRTWPRRFAGRALAFLSANSDDDTVCQLTADASETEMGNMQLSPQNAGVGGAFLLVREFGRRWPPGEWLSQSSRAEMDAGRLALVSAQEDAHHKAIRLVERCIQYLSDESRASAGGALRRLAELAQNDGQLAPWRNEIKRARDKQRDIRRQVTHQTPLLQQIGNVLTGGPPANAADLVAIVEYQIERLKKEIRDGNTDGWEQFWKDGKKMEDETYCGRRLVEMLQPRLELMQIDVHQESHYAERKRADIRASAAGGVPSIPIEIKKSISDDLWTAPEEQLCAKYARDPASEGHGIYLVLWSGQCHRPPAGTTPQSLDELEEHLRARLPDTERCRVHVIVMDVSIPQPPSGLVK